MQQHLSEFGSPEIIGKSIQGPKHEQQGKECQDNWSGTTDQTYFIIAIGDGLGSAKNSAVGSKIATETVVESLDSWLDDFNSASTEPTKTEIKEEMARAVAEARSSVEGTAETADKPIDEYHTTLSVAVVTTKWHAAVAIGDSGLVGVYGEGEYEALLEREESNTATQTTPLTSPSKLVNKRKRFTYEERPLTAVVGFTDGLDRFAWDTDDKDIPRKAFFDQIHTFVDKIDSFDEGNAQSQFEEFVESDKFSRHSGDDKTLVIGRLPKQSIQSQASESKRKKYDNEDFIEAVKSVDSPSIMKVTDDIGCAYSTARTRLQKLEENGELTSSKSGRRRLWKVTRTDE